MRATTYSIATLAMGLIVVSTALVTSQAFTKRIFATVIDRSGAPVRDLAPADFDIKEDMVACRVVRAALSTDPVTVFVLVDNSEAAVDSVSTLRAALKSFLNTVPAQMEIALATVGGDFAMRVKPTMDRQTLQRAAASMAAEPGTGTVLIDALLQIDKQLLPRLRDRWVVIVVITSDHLEYVRQQQGPYEAFVGRLQALQATVHAVIFRMSPNLQGMTASVVKTLTENTNGSYSDAEGDMSLVARTAAVADRIAEDQARMATRYAIDYVSASGNREPSIEIGVLRNGLTVNASQGRLP